MSLLVSTSIFAATHYLDKECYGAISKDALSQIEKADETTIKQLIAENKVVKLKAGTKIDIKGEDFQAYMKKINVNGHNYWIKDVEGQIKKLD